MPFDRRAAAKCTKRLFSSNTALGNRCQRGTQRTRLAQRSATTGARSSSAGLTARLA